MIAVCPSVPDKIWWLKICFVLCSVCGRLGVGFPVLLFFDVRFEWVGVRGLGVWSVLAVVGPEIGTQKKFAVGADYGEDTSVVDDG